MKWVNRHGNSAKKHEWAPTDAMRSDPRKSFRVAEKGKTTDMLADSWSEYFETLAPHHVEVYIPSSDNPFRWLVPLKLMDKRHSHYNDVLFCGSVVPGNPRNSDLSNAFENAKSQFGESTEGRFEFFFAGSETLEFYEGRLGKTDFYERKELFDRPLERNAMCEVRKVLERTLKDDNMLRGHP